MDLPRPSPDHAIADQVAAQHLGPTLYLTEIPPPCVDEDGAQYWKVPIPQWMVEDVGDLIVAAYRLGRSGQPLTPFNP